jgi:predicted HTH transcriptional regulator
MTFITFFIFTINLCYNNVILIVIDKESVMGIESRDKISNLELKNGLISIVALLNKQQRGRVNFGVSKKGELVGFEEDDVAAIIARQILQDINPKPVIDVKSVPISGTTRKYIEVSFKGEEVPYSVFGQSYYRRENTDILLDDELLEKYMRVVKRKKDHWESQLTEVGIENIDVSLLKEYYFEGYHAKKFTTPFTNATDALTALRLLMGGRLNNAGYYLFSKDKPISVKLLNYSDDEKTNVIDSKYVEGNIFECVMEVMAFINKYNFIFGKRAGQLPGLVEVPADAIREAVLNSFCHADYTSKAFEHKVLIFPNRISIFNPGELSIDIDLEDFKHCKTSSIPYNPLIASAFLRFNLIDTFGKGLQNIFELCKADNLVTGYEFTANGFEFFFSRIKDEGTFPNNFDYKNVVSIAKEQEEDTEIEEVKPEKSSSTVVQRDGYLYDTYSGAKYYGVTLEEFLKQQKDTTKQDEEEIVDWRVEEEEKARKLLEEQKNELNATLSEESESVPSEKIEQTINDEVKETQKVEVEKVEENKPEKVSEPIKVEPVIEEPKKEESVAEEIDFSSLSYEEAKAYMLKKMNKGNEPEPEYVPEEEVEEEYDDSQFDELDAQLESTGTIITEQKPEGNIVQEEEYDDTQFAELDAQLENTGTIVTEQQLETENIPDVKESTLQFEEPVDNKDLVTEKELSVHTSLENEGNANNEEVESKESSNIQSTDMLLNKLIDEDNSNSTIKPIINEEKPASNTVNVIENVQIGENVVLKEGQKIIFVDGHAVIDGFVPPEHVKQLTKIEFRILNLIRTDDTITSEQLGYEVNKDPRTVLRAIKVLKDQGYIRRVGFKSGYWELLK